MGRNGHVGNHAVDLEIVFLRVVEDALDDLLVHVDLEHNTVCAAENFIALLKSEPRRFIAQEVIDFLDIDIFEDGQMLPRKADLRAFVLMSDEPVVWKSGLTRFSRNPDSFIVNSSQGGGFKDTWVLSK